jgi:hypothetical protein
MVGIKRIEKIPSPRTSNIDAPGQCMNLNKTHSVVRDVEIAPEINANVFIFI